MNITIDEQIEAQDEICRLGGGPMEYAILATLERVNAAEAGLPVEPDFISEFATHAAGHKAYDIGVTPKQINELVKYIDTIRAYAVLMKAGMMRAAEICRKNGDSLEIGKAASYACAETITRAADQVNADGCTRSHPHDDMDAACERKTTIAREANKRSNTMQAVKKDAPVMKAWNNYKSSDEFKNTRKWALHEEHVEGSLWAAFYTGFFACAVEQVNTDGQQQPASDDVRAALLFCLWHHQGGNSKIGQPIRFALGIGRDEPLTDAQLAIAERVQSALCASHSAVKVQACRTEDRAMLATDAGKELLTKAAAAIAAQQEPDTVAVPIHQLEHWAEYWNGSANEKAMSDALEHILGEVDDLLRAAQEAK